MLLGTHFYIVRYNTYEYVTHPNIRYVSSSHLKFCIIFECCILLEYRGYIHKVFHQEHLKEDTTKYQALKPQMIQFCMMIHVSHTDSVTVMPYTKKAHVSRIWTSACAVARSSCFSSKSVLTESLEVPVTHSSTLPQSLRASALLSGRQRVVGC